ncbi:MAG: hypothetical protein ACKPKO_35105, partial [Candidatus Fonsibacter sp.]
CLKCSCKEGDTCLFPHHNQDDVDEIKAASRRWKEKEKEKYAASSPERGRSPSRGSRSSRWQKNENVSS